MPSRALSGAVSGALLVGAWLLLPPPGYASGQNGGVRGRVVDGDGGAPVAGVSVRLEFLDGVERVIELESDDNGSFVRLGIRLGTYRMTLAKTGYQNLVEEVRVRSGPPARLGDRILIRAGDRPPTPEPPESAAAADSADAMAAGRAALEDGDPEAAVEAFERVVVGAPDSAAAHLDLGSALRAAGRTGRAMESFRRAAALDPDLYAARVAIADLADAEGRHDLTVEALARAVEIRPDSTDALFNLGAAAMNLGDLDRAKQAFDRLLEVAPEHGPARYQLGMIFLNRGDFDAAIEHLEAYLERAPEGEWSPTARAMLARLREQPPR